ncbi:MAG: carboxymuconolactone decarboxylase family protein [Tsuneonella sp.]
MRLTSPRIAPVDMDRLDEEQREVLAPFANPENKVGGGKVLNIFRTLAHAPRALTAFLGWGNYMLSRRNSLPAREREIVILRTGWLCRSGYEFAQHRRIGLDSGLSAEEIDRIKAGPDAPGWTPLEAAMLRAADELVSDHFVSDATWAALGELGDKERMDLVFTVGQYTQVSMMLNSFGVQLEDPADADPDLAVR